VGVGSRAGGESWRGTGGSALESLQSDNGFSGDAVLQDSRADPAFFVQNERQEARHASVTRNAARGEAGLSNCGENGRAWRARSLFERYGQGCVRFKSLADLALDVVGRTVARVSAEEHMANYQAARERGKQQRKERRQEVRGEEGETKEVTLVTALSET
jgi:hypothetical protein